MPFLEIGVILELKVTHRCAVQVKYSVTKWIGQIVV
jgi:hypothetical protein